MDDTTENNGKGRATIEIKDLEFGYNPNNPVLKNISHIFDTPEFICIMGPNGVGKSTLIHCINKILKPTRGAVLINGRDTKEMKLKEVANEIGYVPASSEDSFPLTVVDTVMVGMQNDYKFGVRKDDLDKVYDILKLLRIDHLAMRDFNELSAGQHQKMSIAKGLAQTPRVLILDEPTSNLDVRHQLQVTERLRDIAKENGMTVIMVSHDLNTSAKYADLIVMMAPPGVIHRVGTPEEVLTAQSISEIYGVECSVVDSNGRPHVILERALDDDEIRARGAGIRERTDA